MEDLKSELALHQDGTDPDDRFYIVLKVRTVAVAVGAALTFPIYSYTPRTRVHAVIHVACTHIYMTHTRHTNRSPSSS